MENTESGRIHSRGTVVSNYQKGIQIENPFAFKAFQVFTGFGVGCGIGIGAGSPINLASVPMVGQVMSAARGATDAFSDASRHVNDALWRLGAKNIKAGVGCGVGFGHGFGVGLAVKPSAVQKIQSCLVQATAKLMVKLGMAPDLPRNQNLQSGFGNLINERLNQQPLGIILQSKGQVSDHTSQVLSRSRSADRDSPFEKTTSSKTKFPTRTEQVLNDFLQNPLLKQQETKSDELVGRLQSENNVLQMVLKHQKMIEELTEENEKLRKILVEDLKVPPSKLEIKAFSKYNTPCSDCFECRRKQKRTR